MERAGFVMTMAAAFFSVFLLVWQGYKGPSADWVYGFLAVFWSLLMMLRLLTLSTPADSVEKPDHLAQKIIGNFRGRQEENRQLILETSFGGSYLLFILGGLIFAAWQVYCALFPAQDAAVEGFVFHVLAFFRDGGTPLWLEGRLFDWGQGFMLLMSFLMMGFVLRSHAVMSNMTRPMLLILCMYAVAGYITFAGLENPGKGAAIMGADFTGNGTGAASYLSSGIAAGKVLNLFEILILESGITGLAILSFLVFIPVGFISMSIQNSRSDIMVSTCGIVTGVVLILSVFLSFTPALGALMALCWMGLFLSWGHAENAVKARLARF